MDNFANQHKLIEGEWYSLKILKLIEFENEWFYLLETPFKTRITIPAEPYKNYSFTIGEEIRCKVDKVSCSGKIYLEPEHPFYKAGFIYSFEFAKIIEVDSLYGGKITISYYKDKLNNLIEIPIWIPPKNIENPIDLKILRIKKAQIIAFPTQSPYITEYSDNQELELTFFEKFINQYGEIEYIVFDQYGGWNIIPAKYFSTIEIPKNSKLNAIAVKHPTNSYFYIQPEHPIYKNGNAYPFVVTDVKINTNTLNSNNIPEIVVSLKDNIYSNYKLVSFIENPPKIGETILLITLGIRKGVLHLHLPK